MLERLRAAVENEGRTIVMVPVEGDDERFQAAEILRNHGTHALLYAGRWTIERL